MSAGPVETTDGTVELDGDLGVAQALLVVTGEVLVTVGTHGEGHTVPAQLQVTMDRSHVRALRDQCISWLDRST